MDETHPTASDDPRIMTIFRSRLRPDSVDEYHETAPLILELARSMPGFVDFKTFEADDGERVSVVTFASMAAHRAWRDHPEHRAAQQMGRDRFFSSYVISVCEVIGENSFRH